MKILLIIGCIVIQISCFAQVEWEDIKGHEGSGSNSNWANANPDFQHGRFRNTKLRNQEKNTIGNENATESKESKKRLKKLQTDREAALEKLKQDILFKPGQKIIDCNVCAATGLEVCLSCKGRGSSECNVCHGVLRLDCRSCNGEGLVQDLPCGSCKGIGKKVCQFCSDGKILCRDCAGLGYANCGLCHGALKVLASDSTKSNH